MKTYLLVFFLFAGVQCTLAQSANIDVADSNQTAQKEGHRSYRLEWRKKVHDEHRRVFIGVNYTFSNLKTIVSFQPPDDIVTVSLRLESDLRLPDQDEFFTANFLGRITPRSSIYAKYYGINRRSNFSADRDYVFLNDTIPAGTSISPFFNTQVVSFGYMYTALSTPEAFLGFYFNVYLLSLTTGIDSNLGDVEAKLSQTLPLPDLGFLGKFEINPWLEFKASAGFFGLRIEDFGGRLYDLNVGLLFRPAKWVSFEVGYQEFDILVDFLERNLETTVRYNFRGPSVGLKFSF